MEKNRKKILKGVFYVGLGASFYGMLATFVKLAYNNNYTTAEVTASQFGLGFLGLFILMLFQKKNNKNRQTKPVKKDFIKLILAGTSLGGTSLFYYLCVQYVDVSIAIILLMQSVWFSVVIESIAAKELPEFKKIIAVVIVLFGTVLATNLIDSEIKLDIRGIFWGVMAAMSYTVTMFTANKIANYLPPVKKSLIMLSGGGVLILLFLIFSQIGPLYSDNLKSLYLKFSDDLSTLRAFDFSIFYTYGLILALFGTIIPPVFLNKGFPLAGLGLGSIVSSIELPVSVMMAYILLGESIMVVQWIGIIFILFAIVLMNFPSKAEK